MLAYGAVQSPLTIYEKIRSFPAGATQRIDGQTSATATPRRFWDFPRRRAERGDDPTAAADVQRLLREAVLKHLVADVPVGVFLSGGIDSTIIASFTRKYTPAVKSFTAGFGSLCANDESEIAAATAAHLGIRHTSVRVDATKLPDAWDDWLAFTDSLSIDGFNTYRVSRQLASEGIVVGLFVIGADELFGGYSVFGRAPRLSQMMRVLKLLPPSLLSSLISAPGSLDGRSAAFEKMADVLSGNPIAAGVVKSLRRVFSNDRLAALRLTPAQAGAAHDYLPMAPGRHEPPCDGDSFNTVFRAELVHYMGDTLLRDTDANSMRHSLEVRVPFLDLALVNYVSALPGSVKRQSYGASKALLRRACQHVLPDTVARRPKTGFTLPIGFWMRNQMREFCEDAITRLAKSPFMAGAEVTRIWNDFLARPRSMHWSRPLSLVVLATAVD